MPATARLRAACDICHELKVRCSGNLPCEGCSESGMSCFYSITNRLGRPPGAKNKRKASPAANANVVPDRATMKLPPQPQIVGSGDQEGKNVASGRGGWSLDIASSLQRLDTETATHNISWPLPQQQLPSPRGSARNSIQTVSSISSNIGELATAATYRHDLMGLDDAKESAWDSSWSDLSVFRGGWNWSSTDDLSLGSREAGNHADMISVDPTLGQAPGFGQFGTTNSSNSPEHIHAGSAIEQTGGPGHNQADGNVSKAESVDISDCLCLQRHTEFLCALKRPKATSGSASPDKGSSAGPCLSRALLNIQNGLQVWNSFIECPKCAHNHDHEVLLLALMCMRAALFQLQRAGWGDFNTSSPAHLFPILSLGDFEVKGDDKLMLLHALRSITLRKTESVLMRLKETLERKKALENVFEAPDRNWDKRERDPWAQSRYEDGASNLGHADQMMQGLVRFVKMLENG